MKNIILILILICTLYNATAQESLTRGTYEWNEKVLMTPLNHLKAAISINERNSIESRVGQKFSLLEVETDGTAIIEVLDYNVGSDKFILYNFNGTEAVYDTELEHKRITSEDFGKYTLYFKVKTSDIALCATKVTYLSGSLSVGVINYLVKYRGQKGKIEFSGASNIGGAVGYTFPHRTDDDWSISVLMGVGIGNINLDSSSVTKSRELLQSVNNFTAFSGSVGLLIGFKKVQLGFFTGFDRVSNIIQKQFDWQYQGNPWLSIGLGFNVFSPQEGKVVSSGDNKSTL